MKQTSLFETHRALGATMVPFAGWDMPVSYQGTVAEVAAVHSGAGIFDVSHMGEARVTGPNATAFVQSLTTNNVTKLVDFSAQYSLLLNDLGGVIDDIIVYRITPEEYLIVLNAGCKDKDWAWIQQQAAAFGDVNITDDSDATALIAVQGPTAVALVSDLLGSPELKDLPRFHFTVHHALETRLILSRTGYTGEDGFEIFCGWHEAPAIWHALVAAGAVPAGLGARDVLRLEAGYPLYGHELDAETSPLECGVGWAIKLKKGEFMGREAVAAKRDAGLAKKLVGLRMVDRGIPREHYHILDQDGETPVGEVTSGTFSPTVKAGIAMARINMAHSKVGTPCLVDIRGRLVTAEVVALPFYRNGV